MQSFTPCPRCSSKLEVRQLVREVENFGKVLFSTLLCSECGFKLSDVQCVESSEPLKFSLKVLCRKDLNAKLVKSSTTTVKIPELNVSIEPGPASEGFITNVEGLLDRVEQADRILLNRASSVKEVKAAEKSLQKVLKAKNAEFPFTVKLFDAFGNCSIVSKKAKKFKLSGKEIAGLKQNLNVLEVEV